MRESLPEIANYTAKPSKALPHVHLFFGMIEYRDLSWRCTNPIKAAGKVNSNENN